MKSARRLVALGLGALALWGHPGRASAGQATIFVNYGEGDGFCAVCGVVDYTMTSFGTWGGGVRTFVDPSPPGAVVVQLVANVQGTCDSNNTLTVAGATVGTSTLSGTGCACDSCFDGTVATGATYDAGWPGYTPGAANAITISQDVDGAIDGVDVTVIWRLCGDAAVDPGEACDAGGDSPTCDADCTPAVCGDGTRNAAAGEACDEGGASPTCRADCTLPACGDGEVDALAGEECDDGAVTATCNIDCTLSSCGDGVVNPAAGEACDHAGASAGCDDDCSAASCGDGTLNAAAGEACDDGNVASGDGCSADCIGEPTGGAGAGGGGGAATGSTSGAGGGAGSDGSGAGGDASGAGGEGSTGGSPGAGGGGPGTSTEAANDGGCGCTAAGAARVRHDGGLILAALFAIGLRGRARRLRQVHLRAGSRRSGSRRGGSRPGRGCG